MPTYDHSSLTKRNFARAAAQRLSTAEFLLKHQYNLDAMYLAGYAIECALKAAILQATSSAELPDVTRRICAGSKMHRFDLLAGLLRDRSVSMPAPFAGRFRRFAWSTDLRYQSGRVSSGEARGFWKLARDVQRWSERRLT